LRAMQDDDRGGCGHGLATCLILLTPSILRAARFAALALHCSSGGKAMTPRIKPAA